MKSGKSLSRRNFLQLTSLTSFALLPGNKLLSGLFEQGKIPDELLNYRYFNPYNLLSLEFYFINMREENGWLERKWTRDYQESYMIVRLPQQHIDEENISSEKLDGKATFFASTHISGYSFLVFEILYKQKSLPLKVADLLDWNDHQRFRLVVREQYDESIFHIELKDSKRKVIGVPPEKENHYPLGYREDARGLIFSPEYYPRAYERVTKSGTKYIDNQEQKGQKKDELKLEPVYSAPSPVTAIEAPYRIILSPQLPDPDKYRFGWKFPATGLEGNELWVATLYPERVPDVPPKPAPKKKTTVSRIGDPENEASHMGDNALRFLLIGSPDYEPEKYKSTDTISSRECPKDKNRLPNEKDRSDLIDLYIRGKMKAHAPEISFSPLGVSMDMSFRNTHIMETVKMRNTLYEWNQSVSYGRDQQVDVSRVVMEDCFGFKMLHVRKTKRQTYKGVSMLVYRQYIAPLELEKDYTLYVNNKQLNAYADPNWKCASPFKKIELVDKTAKQIATIEQMVDWLNANRPRIGELIEFGATANNADGCWENLLSFWPLTRKGEFLEWEFKATDWHGETHVFKKKLHLLTSNLTYNTTGQEYLFPQRFEEEIRAFIYPELQKGLLPVAQVETHIQDRIGKLKEPSAKYHTWVSILEKGEQIALDTIDYYTAYLESSLADMEAKIRGFTGQIEDQAMEEWAIFKRKVLEQEQKIMRVVEAIIRQAEEDKKRMVAPPANWQAYIDTCKGYRQEILDAIHVGGPGLVLSICERIKKIREKIKWFFLETKTWEVKASAEAYAALDRVLAYFSELKDVAFTAIIGFEQDYREFLEKLPGKLRNLIRTRLLQETANIRGAIDEIRGLEAKARGRIEMFNAKVGYAVYKVEEELDTIRRKLEALGGNWQENYEKLRDEYQKKLNGELSKMETRFMLLRGNIRTAIKSKVGDEEKKLLEFFDDNACFPQLHSAEVLVKNINDMVNREIPCKIRYAREYAETQVDDFILDTRNNVSRVFVVIKGDAKEYIKSAVKEVTRELGGIVSPALAAEYITYLKDARKEVEETANRMLGGIKETKDEWAERADKLKEDLEGIGKKTEDEIKGVVKDIEEIKSELEQNIRDARNSMVLIGKEAKEHFEQYRDWANVEGKAFFKGLEAKILGAIHLRDILGPGFELPKLNRADKSLYYRFMTDKLMPATAGPFSFHAMAQQKPAQLMVYMEKPLTNPTAYKAWTRLSNFAVGIFEDRLLVEFDSLQVYSDQRTKGKVDVKISDVKFYKELAYLEALAKNIKIPGTGLTMGFNAKEIFVKFAYSVPGISGGAFTFDNLRFGINVSIPLPIGANRAQEPATARFAVNEPDDKFVVAAGIWGGKGHFVIETTPKYIKRIDSGIDFGGYLALSLGIAKGEAFLMAGIRFVYLRDEMGEVDFMLYATISCGGSVTVFGFITISVIFLLCLKYSSYQGRSTLYGIASVTYSIKIGFFRKSFTLTFSRRLYGSEAGSAQNDIGFNDQPQEMMIIPAVYRTGADDDESFVHRAARFDREEEAYLAKERKKPLRDQVSACNWLNMTRTYHLPSKQ